MKYRMLKAGEARHEGDEYQDRKKKWGPAQCLGVMTEHLVGYYRRPIPEKKAARAVDWKRVARLMAKELTDRYPNPSNENGDPACVVDAIEIYTRALARARKGAKGGR